MYKHLYFIIILLSICSCSDNKPDFRKQKVQFGFSTVKGEIFNYPALRDSIVIMSVGSTITAEYNKYSTRISGDGTFSFNVPVECNQYASISICDSIFGVFLIPNSEIKVGIEFSGGKIHVNKNDLILSISEKDELFSKYQYLGQIGKIRRIPLIDKPADERTLDDYSNAVTDCLDNLRKQADSIFDISDIFGIFIYNEIKMTDLSIFMEPERYRSFVYTYWEDTNPPALDISFYKFLKAFNLNSPDCLYGCYYLVMQQILSNSFFAIPPIEDTPIEKWLDGVKKTMADLVGFDKGLFYDILAANAYSKQFNDKLQPLSEKQKENIQKYFKDKHFVKILLEKNEEIEKLAGITAHLQINETPTLPDGKPIETYSEKDSKNLPEGKILDAIISKYRGKTVVVDFWATWCAPCMKAMSESRELKAEMISKDIVFVYITNRSSPKELWQQKIPGIGGEHYYLDKDGEWKSISYSEKYGFEYIPTYLIFDSEGHLRKKLSAYPGNDVFRGYIEELSTIEINCVSDVNFCG